MHAHGPFTLFVLVTLLATAAQAHIVAAQALGHLRKMDLVRQALDRAIELDPTGPCGRQASQMLQQAGQLGLIEASDTVDEP